MTASGRPSGIATTMMVTEYRKNCNEARKAGKAMQKQASRRRSRHGKASGKGRRNGQQAAQHSSRRPEMQQLIEDARTQGEHTTAGRTCTGPWSLILFSGKPLLTTHHLMSSAMKQVAATDAPILPTVAATCASFSCKWRAGQLQQQHVRNSQEASAAAAAAAGWRSAVGELLLPRPLQLLPLYSSHQPAPHAPAVACARPRSWSPG